MRCGRTVNLFCDATTRGRAFRLGSIVGALLTTVLMSLAQADEPSAQSAAKKKPSGEKATADRKGSSAQKAMSSKPAAVDLSSSAFEPVSPKREAAAVLFAKQHHAELAELLDRLKASHPEQYIKAIRELDRTRDKLEKQRERDADRYAILLREWQVDSRVRLLAARMTMSENAGELLRHDHVVRQYTQAGNFTTAPGVAQKLTLRTIPGVQEHPRRINLVVFEPRTGRTLQAVSAACTG